MSSKLLTKRKIYLDKTFGFTSFGVSLLFSLIFIALIVFVIYASIPGFKFYGAINILFSGQFDLSKNKVSIWLPLSITIISSTIAIIIAAPIGIKTAIFIKYRISIKWQKMSKILFELLAAAPSVIFGLFASEMLGFVLAKIFQINNSYNIIAASFMLAIMILPTIISLTLNNLNGIDHSLLTSAMVLGNSKTRAIYKVCKKECKNGITTTILIAISRAIGETMAISMILQSQMYNNVFNSGFWSILTSGLRSLGALISANMFAESAGPELQSLLFAFGVIMFILVIIINTITMQLTKKKNNVKYTWWNRFTLHVNNIIWFIPNLIKLIFEKLTFHSKISKYNTNEYIGTRVIHKKFIHLYDGWKIFWEWFSIIVTSIFLFWIIENIFINGIIAISSKYSSLVSFAKDTSGMALLNTLLIIFLTVLIGFPISLFVAIYLNEFARNNKFKSTILFFIDSLGATPSILFGMFGLIFYIQTLGWTSQGAAGKSIIAGILTILIVILPTFIRTIQQALQNVPIDLRVNSYALGASKSETIKKIVLPLAWKAITTSIVLAIGRILAETAPLYLTSGLASGSVVSLSNEGQTLTTRIYAQIYESNITKGSNIMYECAFITMVLILLIILFVNVFIPWYYQHREHKKNNATFIVDKKYKINTIKANKYG